MFKIIVAGGRKFDNYSLLSEKLDVLLKKKINDALDHKGIQIVSGKAQGADSLGEKYAKERGYGIKEFPADWSNLKAEKCIEKDGKFGKYNALAGHNRNEEMAKYADACVVFWDGKSTGSKSMIELAKKYNLPTRIIDY